MRIYHKTMYKTFSCPKCGKELKSEKVWDYGNDGCYMFLACLFVLPIILIALLIGWIVKSHNKKNKKYTDLGEDLIFCKHCKSFVAFTINGTRLLSRQEIEDTIVPRYKDNTIFQKQYKQYIQYNQQNLPYWGKL